jgi:hypothetical protein
MMILIGGTGVFLGGFVGIIWLRSGESSYTITSNGVPRTVIANRATDPDTYWRNVIGFGLLPILLGGASAAYAWRRLRRG